MKKKFLIMLIAFMFNFLLIESVSASIVTCEYGDYKVQFEIKEQYMISTDAYKNDVKLEGLILTDEQLYSHSGCPKYLQASTTSDLITLYNDVSSLQDTTDLIDLTNSYTGKTVKVSCGNITGIPKKLPELTNMAVNLIQIAIPVILILMGSIDLFKGVAAQKEDEMKKGQQMFIKRLIVAAIIFFVIVIVKFLISIVADNTSSDNISKCIDCFLSGVENCK